MRENIKKIILYGTIVAATNSEGMRIPLGQSDSFVTSHFNEQELKPKQLSHPPKNQKDVLYLLSLVERGYIHKLSVNEKIVGIFKAAVQECFSSQHKNTIVTFLSTAHTTSYLDQEKTKSFPLREVLCDSPYLSEENAQPYGRLLCDTIQKKLCNFPRNNWFILQDGDSTKVLDKNEENAITYYCINEAQYSWCREVFYEYNTELHQRNLNAPPHTTLPLQEKTQERSSCDCLALYLTNYAISQTK